MKGEFSRHLLVPMESFVKLIKVTVKESKSVGSAYGSVPTHLKLIMNQKMSYKEVKLDVCRTFKQLLIKKNKLNYDMSFLN